MTKKDQTEIVAPKATETALALPFNYGDDAGIGQDELGITSGPPALLVVLQSGSHPAKKGHDAYIVGAEAGMLFNTKTQDLMDGEAGITFVPIGVEHLYVERIPYDESGGGAKGFIGVHAPTSELVERTIEANRKRLGKKFIPKPITESGHELIETYYVVGLILDAPNGNVLDMAIFPFASTKIKPYRAGIDSLKSFAKGVPIFAHQVLIRTKYESRTAGDSFNIVIQPALGEIGQTTQDRRKASLIGPDTELYAFAKLARAKFEAGEVEVSYGTEGGEESPDVAAAKGAF